MPRNAVALTSKSLQFYSTDKLAVQWPKQVKILVSLACGTVYSLKPNASSIDGDS